MWQGQGVFLGPAGGPGPNLVKANVQLLLGENGSKKIQLQTIHSWRFQYLRGSGDRSRVKSSLESESIDAR